MSNKGSYYIQISESFAGKHYQVSIGDSKSHIIVNANTFSITRKNILKKL